MPSLWTAVAGDRPVADAHDDPGHITWGWKDRSLDKKIWYYGKILRRKATHPPERLAEHMALDGYLLPVAHVLELASAAVPEIPGAGLHPVRGRV